MILNIKIELYEVYVDYHFGLHAYSFWQHG